MLLLLSVTTACSDKEEEITQLDNCLNHYRAESYLVAKTECKIAAEQGVAEAQWLMAHIYRFDLLAEGKDLEQAFQWYLQAAEQGHIAAMREVGLSYQYETGVVQDFDKAYYWLSKAAKKRDTSAEFAIGFLFFDGKGRDKDVASAISWYKRAAMKGHDMSINNLAWIFSTSKNAAFNNPKKASYWASKMDDELLQIAMFLDTKAAVMASQQDFEQAIKLQNLAISKLPEETPEKELLEYQKHLESYQHGEAWYE